MSGMARHSFVCLAATRITITDIHDDDFLK